MKAIFDVEIGDDPTKCNRGKCEAMHNGQICIFGVRKHPEDNIRLPACLAATKLAERIINELNRLRDLAGEEEYKLIGELLAELEVSDDD